MIITYNEEDYNTDYFFESMIYRQISDEKLNIYQKATLLFIARKTIGFKKLWDKIGNKEFEWNLSISEAKIKATIKELISFGLIIRELSKGGAGGSRDRFNSYRLGDNLLIPTLDRWIEIKEENGYNM